MMTSATTMTAIVAHIVVHWSNVSIISHQRLVVTSSQSSWELAVVQAAAEQDQGYHHKDDYPDETWEEV